MKKLTNKNNIEFIEIIESNNYYYFVMEYCEYNLDSFLTKKRNTSLLIEEIKKDLTDLNKTFKIMIKEI